MRGCTGREASLQNGRSQASRSSEVTELSLREEVEKGTGQTDQEGRLFAEDIIKQFGFCL